MKKIRLPLDAYRTAGVWHLSLRATKGTAPFADADVVASCLETLRGSASKYRSAVYVYCFMPDHLHLLVGNDEGNDLIRFVRHFKQLIGFNYKRAHGTRLWQDRFYDRCVRRYEDIDEVARYIWENPVQAGLVQDGEDYPFAGTLVLDDAPAGG